MMQNDSVQGFDIHGEYEFMCARKMNILKDLESMFGILDVGRYVPNQECHNMIKITGDEFSGTTTG